MGFYEWARRKFSDWRRPDPIDMEYVVGSKDRLSSAAHTYHRDSDRDEIHCIIGQANPSLLFEMDAHPAEPAAHTEARISFATKTSSHTHELTDEQFAEWKEHMEEKRRKRGN